jgi:competence protein ComEA
MKKYLLLFGLFSSPIFATPVNINSANAQTIAGSLTGISLKKAEAIVADRDKNGAFTSIHDLKRVIGMGEKTIAVNKADILFANEALATPAITFSITTTLPSSQPVQIIATPTKSAPPLNLNRSTENPRISWLTGLIIVIIALFAIATGKYYQQQTRIK